MGRIFATIVFTLLVLCAKGGECEIRKSGASFGNDSVVLTLTKNPDGFFVVFPHSKEGVDFDIKSFDPGKLPTDNLGSFYLSLNQSGFFSSITVISGERASLGGDVFFQLNSDTAVIVRRTPQPLLVILSKDSIIAFLGMTLVFNERWPELVQATKEALTARGEEPYSFNLKGDIVFNKRKVGARIGIESNAEFGCEAPDTKFQRGGEDTRESSSDASPPVSVVPGVYYYLEDRAAYRGSEEKGGAPSCLLTPIPRP